MDEWGPDPGVCLERESAPGCDCPSNRHGPGRLGRKAEEWRLRGRGAFAAQRTVPLPFSLSAVG